MVTTQNSVAAALQQAHVALQNDLRALGGALVPTSRDSLPDLRTRLEATRAHITRHFAFEEENGYMDAVREREPRLERHVEELADEHSQIIEALGAIIDEAAAAPDVGVALRKRIRQWIKRVRRHETRENDLVQDAFLEDIGAED